MLVVSDRSVGGPTGPDHSDPSAGDYPYRMWVPSTTCTSVAVAGARRVVSRVVDEPAMVPRAGLLAVWRKPTARDFPEA
jgi:hypothetical protein